MTRFDTHFCLVSAQATPNLAPALDPGFAPRRVVLAISHDMRQRGDWLSAILKRHDVTVETIELADPYDYYGCCDNFLTWLSEQQCEVALNVTGGTKIMAMAAQEVFRSNQRPVFYINVENDHVIVLDNRDAGFTLPTRIKLREYLEAHGYSLPNKPAKPNVQANLRDLVGRLACDSERLGPALGRLNWLAQEARNNLSSPPLDRYDKDSRGLDELISLFTTENQLALQDGHIVFPDEAARLFVNGGWLELHVYAELAGIAPELGVADYAVGLEVLATDGKTRNELDAAILHRNTLYIVECKSANLAASGKTNDDRGTEALYKLDTLRKMGGLRTRAMLIDFRGGLSESDQRRAAQLGIRVVLGRQLRNLRGELKGWLHAAA
jgi:hypothetical protein